MWAVTAVPQSPPDAIVQPWVQALVRRRQEDFGKDRPSYQCLPSGPEILGSPKRIVQTPTFVAILNDDLTYRQIFMDGRKLETDPNPTWMGYSVARWDGDVLVVDSFGFNDRTWLAAPGLPHTDALRVNERYRRPDFGHLQAEVTFTDPGAYTKPWSVVLNMRLLVDTEMLENVCEFHPEHWVGKASDAQAAAATVATDILATYVGVYSGLWFTTPRTVEFVLLDGQLVPTINGRQGGPLVAQSQTLFVGTNGLGYEFIGDGKSVATHVVEHHVSGSYKYARQR
jgi:hypothetical protein